MYYYITKYSNGDLVIVELEKIKSKSLFGKWTIVKYIVGEPGDVGHDDNVQPGATISGNELNGVGMSGPDAYIFNEKDSIMRLFKYTELL